MMQTKGYIFDYGGTLDTGGCHWGKKIWHAYQRENVPFSWERFREAYIYAERYLGAHRVIQPEHTFRQLLQIKLRLELQFLRENGSWTTTDDLCDGICERLLRTLYDEVMTITAHSREVLTRLATEAPMVLVSNFYGNMPVVMREFGLDGLFRQIIESSVVGVRKPDPRIFQMGVEALGLNPEEVTVVGDSIEKDIIPARSVGCWTVWLKGEGWNDDLADESIPDRVITDLRELTETE
ncbi:MAG: HAD family hydrolase [Prevotella sp.]|nr:HAD family hydrolase [Prevotella sp.]